jgi:RNA-directed DNA polymerase
MGFWRRTGHGREAWLLRAVVRRLREEFAKLDLKVNEAKSRVVDLTQGEAFGFLGFTIRRLRSTRGKWWVQQMPAMKQRTVLLQKLREEFRRWGSQPVGRVIAVINPILRGWVNYFRVGNAARCFSFVKTWVERRVRRHLMRARGRRGFGWKRWSRAWLYMMLGLFNDYRVSWAVPENAPSTIGPITLDAKSAGERRTGNPFAPLCVQKQLVKADVFSGR